MEQTDWTYFRDHLLAWYRPERRPMPWKEAADPYQIWLSEIILQQTRVEQGLPYFQRFVAAYPTVKDLARAPDDEVMKLWEGLGYYSRARNLLRAARLVTDTFGGRFPNTYEGLRALPGIGPYTAAAIASFAFGRQVAVLDGNVFRVLARYTGDATPIDTGKGRKHFTDLAKRALGEADAARFNQAIMDFGALVCTPRRADCGQCPLAPNCTALATDRVYELPVKGKKLARRDRFFHYLVVTDGRGHYLIEQRTEKDVWQDLYQFPLIEARTIELTDRQLLAHPDWPTALPREAINLQRRSVIYRHQLTHQRISVLFHVAHLSEALRLNAESAAASRVQKHTYQLVSPQELRTYALPRVITRFLEDGTLTLGL